MKEISNADYAFIRERLPELLAHAERGIDPDDLRGLNLVRRFGIMLRKWRIRQ